MERLMPIDLERIQLGTGWRGYDKKEVDAICLRAANEIGALLQELKEARETAATMTREVESYRAQEQTLKEALLLAQKAADETRASAHREANSIIEEARRQAGEIDQTAQARIADLRWEIERLGLERQRFESRLRTMLEEQLRLLDQGRPGQPALVNLEVSDAAAG